MIINVTSDLNNKNCIMLLIIKRYSLLNGVAHWKRSIINLLFLLPFVTQAQLPPAPADQRPLFPNEPAGLQRGAYHGQPVRYQDAD